MSVTATAPRRTAAGPWWAGALSGLVATAAGVTLGMLLAALVNAPGPVTTVGNRAVDLAPPFLKDFAVEQFGTNDKPVLIGGVVVVLAIAAMLAGVITMSRPRLGVGLIGFLGLLAVVAAFFDRTSPANRFVTLLPALLTLAIALAVLVQLRRELVREREDGDALVSGGRRAFLIQSFGVIVLAAVAGSLSRVLGGGAAKESRAAVRLPRAADPAPAVPSGAQSPVKGVSPFITPNKDFYRIDTALTVPDVPTDGYSLRIHGLVDDEITLSYSDLESMPLVEKRITLTCVSNEVGGPYVGNATWLGVPVYKLLERVGVDPKADAVKTTSQDGMTIGTPLQPLMDPDRNALIAIGMNGEPLPLIHGFPVRMVVPGLYGYVSATKWLVDFEVTRFADFQAYWTPRGYSEEAPIKFSSRIDVPKGFQTFEPDAVRVGGVAWAQAVGIEKVEVRVDDGAWQETTLAAEDNLDTWRQWSWQWDDATSGSHSLTVRATTKDGKTQTSDRASIRPNGTTGWHSVQFRVA